MQVNFLQLHLI